MSDHTVKTYSDICNAFRAAYKKEIAESDTDVDRTLAAQRAIEAVASEYANNRHTITPQDLNKVWVAVMRFARKHGRGGNDLILAAAARGLLDFNTGPASFLDGKGFRHGERFLNAQDRRTKVPGLRLRQWDFLTGQKRDFASYADLLAEEFAENPKRVGVWALSGVRGSGKSTFLNRIEWFCNNWIAGRKRTVTVRLDLGGKFERERFVWNLLQTICCEVRDHCRREPHSRDFSRPVLAVAEFGSWCETNLRWAGTLLLLSIIAIATLKLMTPTQSDVYQAATNAVSLVSTQNTVFETAKGAGGTNFDVIPSPAARVLEEALDNHGKLDLLKASLSIWLGILVVGYAHLLWRRFLDDIEKSDANLTGFRSFCLALLRRLEPVGNRLRPSLKWLVCLPVLLLGLGLAFSLAPSLVHSAASDVFGRSAGGVDKIDEPAWIAFSLALLLGFVVFVQLCALPKEWRSYELAQTVLRQGKRGDSEEKKLPFLSDLVALVEWLIPKGTELPDLEKMDTAFLEQQLKVVLHRISSDFRRVVILIDDVDVLPNELFHDLFRSLRPLTKVENVCCVVTVPLYFQGILALPRLGDLHSTVRGSVVLGNREMFVTETDVQKNTDHLGQPKPIDRKKSFEEFAKLLYSRLRIQADESKTGFDPANMLVIHPEKPDSFPISMMFGNRIARRVAAERTKPENARQDVCAIELVEWILRDWQIRNDEMWHRIRDLLVWSGGSTRELLRAWNQQLDRDDKIPLPPSDPTMVLPSGSVYRSEWVDILKSEYAKGERYLLCSQQRDQEG